jgi:hypothetical protein
MMDSGHVGLYNADRLCKTVPEKGGRPTLCNLIKAVECGAGKDCRCRERLPLAHVGRSHMWADADSEQRWVAAIHLHSL